MTATDAAIVLLYTLALRAIVGFLLTSLTRN